MTNQTPFVDVHPHQLDYRLLVEECLAGIYLIQGDRFLYVNPTMADLFGYSQTDIIDHHSVADLVAPRDRPRVLRNLRKRFEGEVETLQYTFQALRCDGSTFEVEVRGRRTETGGDPAVIGTLLDVTDQTRERERLEFLARATELLDSSLNYEATLESLARLLIPFFADLCFIDVFEGEGVRRLAAGPWPGEGSSFSIHPAAPAGQEDTTIGDALSGGTGILLESVPEDTARRIGAKLPNQPSDARLEIRSLIVVPLHARGQNIGAITLATTISGRSYGPQDLDFAREVGRRAALAVENARLYREAQNAIQRRDDVLAVVSHDLRTPLNIIVMSTAFALEQDRRRLGPLETVHKAAKEMERLIDDLLDASAIQAGGFSVKPAPEPIAVLIRKCIEMVEPIARQRSVEIHDRIDPADDTLAKVDAGRFTQAICNLLNNALKFTPEGGAVFVRLNRTDGSAIVSVQDSGPGIPEDQLGQVFERFWRLDSGQAGGAGLGLAIVRGIAEAHGGSARVESELGHGCTFHIEVPLA